ncbi:MAG: 4Fe-4S dicluster domain-containing protein [Burkholderiales bacterium]
MSDAEFAALKAAERAASLPDNALARICRDYCAIYERFRVAAPVAERAPYTDSPVERANELKSMALFFDATLAGTCAVPALARKGAHRADETHAAVVLVEYNDAVEPDNPVHDLIKGSDGAAAKLRATEVAVMLAQFIRQLGFAATAHTPYVSDISLAVLARAAGLVRQDLSAPFVGSRFALAAVTTELEIEADAPLGDRPFLEGGAAWWLGVGGTETWWNRAATRKRPGEWSRYPMENVRRVDAATTLIVEDEVPRMPKRSNGFYRGKKGDFGDKVAREFGRFAIKTPAGAGLAALQIAQTPHQDGAVADSVAPASIDPERNRRALKTLLHHLGADIAGTCEAKRYVWYSHDYAGEPIDIYHRNALVIVVDQGFETMAGASGDDWVSGTQSFRAYVRGGQITGVVAAWIRSLGHSARSHTNADSDVIQTPLVVLAGLGEMSRIGETVLNPFIGPRSKSAVVTTNMPLAWDKPIDFGLQDSCRKCYKCARECPCDAITYHEPVMFNGYEQWKQDVQRCTSYRMTNAGGAACGRCMKACPYNNEGLLAHRLATWIATRFPTTKPWFVRLDDRLGNGELNPVKRWWSDLEIVGGKVVKPRAVNRRGLDIAKGDKLKATQKIAYINADMLPPPNWKAPFPVERKAALAAAAKLETPAQARERIKRGGPPPAHYTPPAPAAAIIERRKP